MQTGFFWCRSGLLYIIVLWYLVIVEISSMDIKYTRLCLFVFLLCSQSLLTVLAGSPRDIVFTNTTGKPVFVKVVGNACMHNTGDKEIVLARHQEKRINMLDSGSFWSGCSNRDKHVTWRISDSSGNQLAKVTWEKKSPSWSEDIYVWENKDKGKNRLALDHKYEIEVSLDHKGDKDDKDDKDDKGSKGSKGGKGDGHILIKE